MTDLTQGSVQQKAPAVTDQALKSNRVREFLQVPKFDFRYVGEHLRNYSVVVLFAAFANAMISKGANYDPMVPWLGAAIGCCAFLVSFIFGLFNVLQFALAVPKQVGRWFVPIISLVIVLESFLVSAFLTTSFGVK
ncbi:hypothetical protein [Ralstonia wenshanensis]|uniref:hypothetical protein n=1 Tax=Ralstonia wenshanensis TaxID=2842456 RepID=UPI002AAE2AAD|nr:hypothetical protein [Ralstonia wenshanensis]MDY7508804.1 hypothetical protein [Ralstonia wenshanensis]